MVRRILVVEDERRLAELVKAFLADKGYAVLVAHDGEKGVETALREKPAVVLSDVLLPKLNGWDLCRRIKAEPTLAATRVILMTAVYTKPRYRTDATEAGADDFVPKPLDLEDLAVRIGRLFHFDRPPAATARPAPPVEEAEVPPAPPAPKVEAKASSSRVAEPRSPAASSPAEDAPRVRRQVALPEPAPVRPTPPVDASAPPAPTSPTPRPATPAHVPQASLPEPPTPRRQKPRLDVDATLAGLAPKPRVAPREASSAKPASGNGSDFDLHLAAMRRRFAAGLPATLSRIERAWVAAAGGGEHGQWDELAHLAHDLAGSAGSFGLPAVGDSARELEEAVRTHVASGVPIGAKARAAIKQHVEQLGALIHLL